MQDDNFVKILFRFHSDTLDQLTVETVWAAIVDKKKGHYQIDNIPFYIPMISSGDIVFAEYDEQEERLTYRETIRVSGNSTIQVVLLSDVQTELELREVFKQMGCESEGTSSGYFVMEVPQNLNYAPIKQKLHELFKDKIIDYTESCLSEQHGSQQ
jgi:hypothetical protein